MTSLLPNSHANYSWRIFAALGGLFVIALFLDIPISTWVHQSAIHAWLNTPGSLYYRYYFFRLPGRAQFPIVACAYLLILAQRHKQRTRFHDALLLALAAIFSIANAPLKWLFGRTRPFHDVAGIHNVPPFHLMPFRGGLFGIIRAEQNLSFPSGDASLAFAMTASFCMIAPRLWPVWLAMGIMVAVERVLEGAHYPSDVVGGAALGVLCALLARTIVKKVEYSAEIKGDLKHESI